MNEPLSELIAPETPEMVAYLGKMFVDKGLDEEDISEITGFAVGEDENPFTVPRKHLRSIQTRTSQILVQSVDRERDLAQ